MRWGTKILSLALACALSASLGIEALASEAQDTPDRLANPPFPPPFPPGGGPWPPTPPTPPAERGRACFFVEQNFRGQSFCLRANEQMRDLGQWAGRISSVQVEGNAEVTLCRETNLRGDCLQIIWSVTDLSIHGDIWNDSARSLRVR